jgi:ADP-ribose pyrophosphatase
MVSSSLKSRIAWQGRSWRLRVDSILLPDGSAVEKGIIDHPGSVVIVPLQESDKGLEVLMLRQFRLALDNSILELPAGTRDWEEDWLACAQRELREETGFRAGYFADLGSYWPAPGLSNELMNIYLATSLQADPLTKDGDEIIEVEPIPLNKLVGMALDGRLQDAKSVVGILRTNKYLHDLTDRGKNIE